MQRALFEYCALSNVDFNGTDLSGAIFRHCDLSRTSLGKAKRHRTQLLHASGYEQGLSGVLVAPLLERSEFKILPKTQILSGHVDGVTAVAWSPDGKRILTKTRRNEIRIWDVTSGEQASFFITALPEGEYVALSADQTKVIHASAGAWRWLGRLAVLPDGKLERIPVEIDGPLPPLGPDAEVE